MARYCRIAPAVNHSPPHFNREQRHREYSGTMKGFDQSAAEVPLVFRNETSDGRAVSSSNGSFDPKASGKQGSWNQREQKRSNTGISLTPSGPWEHKLTDKYLGDVPSSSNTVRYFNRRRQARRVFIDCLIIWCVTAFICAVLASTMYGFSTITRGITQWQKYGYNALVTGCSISLGLAFAAQFNQYAEMMRWRFLAAQYRNMRDFELVLGCSSYRNTLQIAFRGWRPGTWYPTKQQIVALCWFSVFVTFNVFVALIGLTYSIDVSNQFMHLVAGEMDVANLRYIASGQQPDDGVDYPLPYQQAAANLFGQLGQNSYELGADTYTFVNANPKDRKSQAISTRYITTAATCQEVEILLGGHAGFRANTTEDQDTDQDTDQTPDQTLIWVDENGNQHTDVVSSVATGSTTWMSNTTMGGCGPRCAQMLALQTSDIRVVDDVSDSFMPSPRLWACNNTLEQVTHADPNNEGITDINALEMPDLQAWIFAGAIGWTGVCSSEIDENGTERCGDLQYILFNGDTHLSLPADVTAEDVAGTVVGFTIGAITAFDTNGPRQNLTGSDSPRPAQVVVVRWPYAGAILAGIPFVQFVMLLGVVWFSSKAVIIEPGYMAISHILKPIVDKVGEAGPLLSMDEMSDHIGDYNIAYGVRPDPNDPGHHDKTFVRSLGLIDEKEGYGYIRGSMPEGRYD
ncbi:hypothetical protein PV10_02901 [Exophiala mesophila]|uniref:Uncharacterized protein n=1 Tax=Exophiala mesophila TaxID=212818 RepID=A0A0D2A8A8_EXOME|nr:uncharacterized protein PV10_02901 [Exophiala mesophila]KIV95223.1 hypothetical protein PV10_02901 [Exophiala mesophila]